MVDDHVVGRRLGGIELEPNLLLYGRVQSRRLVGAIGWWRNPGCHAAELGVIGSPHPSEVANARNAA